MARATPGKVVLLPQSSVACPCNVTGVRVYFGLCMSFLIVSVGWAMVLSGCTEMKWLTGDKEGTCGMWYGAHRGPSGGPTSFTLTGGSAQQAVLFFAIDHNQTSRPGGTVTLVYSPQ
jgi:hypothetical protein